MLLVTSASAGIHVQTAVLKSSSIAIITYKCRLLVLLNQQSQVSGTLGQKSTNCTSSRRSAESDIEVQEQAKANARSRSRTLHSNQSDPLREYSGFVLAWTTCMFANPPAARVHRVLGHGLALACVQRDDQRRCFPQRRHGSRRVRLTKQVAPQAKVTGPGKDQQLQVDQYNAPFDLAH